MHGGSSERGAEPLKSLPGGKPTYSTGTGHKVHSKISISIYMAGMEDMEILQFIFQIATDTLSF